MKRHSQVIVKLSICETSFSIHYVIANCLCVLNGMMSIGNWELDLDLLVIYSIREKSI